MSWETRNGRGRYFTTTRQVGGRRVRRYFGAGPVGELAATLDASRRVEREARARREKDDLRRLDAAAGPLLALCRATDLLLRAALVAAGLRQHDRGQWRRPRHGRDEQGARSDPGRVDRRTTGPAAACRA